ncbi:MAG: cobalamin B12-binding domain-containing protein [Desulfobacteraceae bacterium]|nr:MAG: cobalamin B12-binding domain-containing protein [Desulfobacteraceae bacterium]
MSNNNLHYENPIKRDSFQYPLEGCSFQLNFSGIVGDYLDNLSDLVVIVLDQNKNILECSSAFLKLMNLSVKPYAQNIGSLMSAHTLSTSAPNDHHELGGRIVSDLLETDGWDVYCLGANKPQPALIRMISEINPFMLSISLAMQFNIDKAAELVNAIRKKSTFDELKIMVGGLAFNENPDVWKITGADG